MPALEEATASVELLAHCDSGLLLKDHERQEARVERMRALHVTRLRRVVHRRQNLREGKSRHEPLCTLLEIESAVERAQAGQDSALLLGRHQRPLLTHLGDLRGRGQRLELDARHRRHLQHNAAEQRY